MNWAELGPELITTNWIKNLFQFLLYYSKITLSTSMSEFHSCNMNFLFFFSETIELHKAGYDLVQPDLDPLYAEHGQSILSSKGITTDGLAYAVSLYFVNLNPVIFQLWRPVLASLDFQLVYLYKIYPTSINCRSDVSNAHNTIYVMPLHSFSHFIVKKFRLILFSPQCTVLTK